MTNDQPCRVCGAVNMVAQRIDGELIRICLACASINRRVPGLSSTTRGAAMRWVVVVALPCLLLAGPVWAEQVVLDGQEFRAHVEHDKQVQADRDNLAQQVTLYKQNETNYKAVVQRQKDLQQKLDEKSSAQESLLATYEAQRVKLVEQQHELAEEVRRVKQDQASLTWQERGKGFAAGMAVVGAIAAYVLRGGR